PLIFILTVSTNAMVFILGFSKNKESDDLSKEEMIAVLNNGNLEKPEKEMMENIIDFDELLAREVMIPRPNIFAIQKNETIESLLNKKNITTYSRVPVYDEDLDDVIGILHIKDLLLLQDKSVTAESLMKEAYFVPDTKKVSQLFMEMKTNNNHMAILIDEYGGVSGIVTLEDLLEELVGDITDEYDKKIYNIVEIGKNKYLVNGDLSINDLNDFLKTDFYSEHYDSVGGLVIEHIGYIPDDNANIDDIYIDGACFKVLKVKNKKIQKVLIKKDAQSN
ncbi:HlyC/CorC family transporter, partial [Sneathia sp. DSM 16630]|nr:HlyC/CorC family transporter [Sneathia sp. DSM 16630]